MLIPIEVSARHIHLSQKDLELLFGSGYQLTIKQTLSQTGEFAAQETIELIGPQNSLRARIVGPARPHTQVELSYSDCHLLGISAPLRLSGDLAHSASLNLVGPAGQLTLESGVIISKRHLHIDTASALASQLHNDQIVQIKISGERGGILDQVVVRVSDTFTLALHLDTDEANALGIDSHNHQAELLV